MVKKLIKLLLVGLVLLLFSFLLFKYSWQLFDDKRELTEFAEKVKTTQSIPDSLMNMYLAVYSHKNHISMTKEIFLGYGSSLLQRHPGNHYANCTCDDVIRNNLWIGLIQQNPVKDRIKSTRLAFALESLIGSDECLNYYVTNMYESIDSDIWNQPYSWKNKPIFGLSKNEFLEYLIIERTPTYFGKFTNPERFELRKKVIEEQIKNVKQ
jgi:hypothetical protein